MNILGRYALWVALLSVTFMSFSTDKLSAVSQGTVIFQSGPGKNSSALWEKAVPAAPQLAPRKMGVLRVEAYGNGAFVANFTPPSAIHSQWLVHAALLGFGIVPEVTSGENAGKKLAHDYAVLDYEQTQLQKIDGSFKAFFSLKSTKKVPAARYGVAVWVTRDNSLIPVQAAGGYLPD